MASISKLKNHSHQEKYVFDYYDDHYVANLCVNEEYYINGNKHDIAYVYDNYNRFRIARA